MVGTKVGEASAAAGGQARAPQGVGLIELFGRFSQLGLSSFGGGVSAWMHRAFVERRGWLGETEFAAALALARIMPGANVVSLAVLIGQRVRGGPGAAAAALGLLVGPGLAVIGLAVAYRYFAEAVTLRAALEGAAAAAAGLLIAMGAGSGGRIIRKELKSGRPFQGAAATAVLAVIFLAIAVFRFPTVPVVLCLAPLSIALALFTAGTASVGKRNG